MPWTIWRIASQMGNIRIAQSSATLKNVGTFFLHFRAILGLGQLLSRWRCKILKVRGRGDDDSLGVPLRDLFQLADTRTATPAWHLEQKFRQATQNFMTRRLNIYSIREIFFSPREILHPARFLLRERFLRAPREICSQDELRDFLTLGGYY